MAKRFVDLLVILFITLNVLAFEFPIYGIPLRYIIFGLMVLLTFAIYPKGFVASNFIKLTTTVVYIYILLCFYSILCDNDITNILLFIRPILVLFAIPSFSYAFQCYGIERYMKIFSLACVVMIVIFLYVFTMSVLDFSYAKMLNEEEGLILVNVNQIVPRVVIKTFVFIIPFSIYVMNKLRGFKLHLCFTFLILIALLSQTFGIVITMILVYFYILHKKRMKKELIYSIAILVSIYLIFNTIYLNDIISSKEGSSDIKAQQILNAFKDLNAITLFLGRGIGCLFSNFDNRNISEPIIEVAAVQIFQMGGLLFSLFILYVYIYPAIRRLNSNGIMKVLALCQIGIFIASMFNPYIWGGGTGLLFVTIIESVPFKDRYKIYDYKKIRN